MPQQGYKHKQSASRLAGHGQPPQTHVHGPVQNAKYHQQWVMDEAGCSYCGLRVAQCLVKCLVCNRFFCNGNTDHTNGQKESHIITHLRTSKHRRIAIFDLREGAAGPLLELYCGKEECGKDDAFDLGMARNASVFDAQQIFCRPCAVAAGNFHRHDWIPFVDCHHPKLKCFNEKIVKVPLRNMEFRLVSLGEIVQIERTWMINFLDFKPGETEANKCVELAFASSEKYCDHFRSLIKLESDLESIECLSFPRLDISISDYALRINKVSTMRFEITSQLHRSTFKKGVQTTVHLESANYAIPYKGWVQYQKNLDNGSALLEIEFDMWSGRPTEQELTKAKVCVDLAHDTTPFKRQQEALNHFSYRQNDELKKLILGTGEDKEKNRPDLILVQFSSRKPQKAIEMMQPAGLDLNDCQKNAVQTALNSSLSLIQGPPGTGKTHTTVAIVYSLLKANPNAKILCCAPSNDPTNHLAVQLAKYLPDYEVTRVNSGRVIHEELPSDVRKLTMHYKLQARFKSQHYKHDVDFEDERDGRDDVVRRSHIICTTCNSVALGLFDRVNLPYVIIDEATQASECDVLIAIKRGCTKLFMIGDHKQLGVVTKFQELEKSNLGLSMFERLMKLKQAPSRMLTVQYRMHPIIARPPSAVIYGNNLHTGPNVAAMRKSDLLHCFLEAKPMGWMGKWLVPIVAVDTNSLHEQAADGSSFLNGQEAILVALVLSNLLHRKVKADDIGVITFYNGQKGHLARQIEEHYCMNNSVPKKLMIDSVDAFQGREKDFIILSCVRSGHQQYTGLGFLRDQRRVNVALTRAKKGVVIVGNLALLCKDKVWSQVLNYYPVVSEDWFVYKLGGRDCTNCRQNKQLPDMPDFLAREGKVFFNSTLSNPGDVRALANSQKPSGQLPTVLSVREQAVRPASVPSESHIDPSVQLRKEHNPTRTNPPRAEPDDFFSTWNGIIGVIGLIIFILALCMQFADKYEL